MSKSIARIHRISSREWYQKKNREKELLREAIESALSDKVVDVFRSVHAEAPAENRAVFDEIKAVFSENKVFGENKAVLGENKTALGENRPVLGENKAALGENRPVFGDNRAMYGDDGTA